MDLRVLGPVEASVDDQPVAIGAGKPRALLAMLALNEGTPVSAERADRRPVGRGAAGDRAEDGAGLRLAAAQGAPRQRQRRRDRHPRPRLRAAARRGRGRRPPLRAADRRGDAARGARAVARPAARRRRHRAVRRRSRSAAWRSCGSRRVELALEQDLAAGRHAEVIREVQALLARGAAARAAARAADARALPQRPPGRRARRLPARARRARQRDRRRARTGAAPPPRGDPAAGPGARPARCRAELPPELEAGTPLVGREAELDALREHWRARQGGDGAGAADDGAPGIGKTRLAAELAAEVQRDGGPRALRVRRRLAEAARRVIERARTARRPTLLVFDDVDHAGRRGRGRARARRRRRPAAARARDGRGAASDAAMTLGPLTPRRRARPSRATYGDAPSGRAAAEESEGVPQRVHRAARRWARAEAARRLGASADRAASERARLQAAEDDLAARRGRAAGARASAPPRRGPVAARSRGSRRSTSTTPTCSSAASDWSPRWWRGSRAPRCSGSSGRRAAASHPRCAPACCPRSRRACCPGSGGWAIALLRPGAHPLRALERAVAGTRRRAGWSIAVDQFEELFTVCSDEAERTAFADALVAACVTRAAARSC